MPPKVEMSVSRASSQSQVLHHNTLAKWVPLDDMSKSMSAKCMSAKCMRAKCMGAKLFA